MTAADASRLLGFGVRKVLHLVDAGVLRSDGDRRELWLSRVDVERLATATRPAPAVEPEHPHDYDEPVDLAAFEQAQLIARFVRAFEMVEPGPCPVCGAILRPRDWPSHLRGHR